MHYNKARNKDSPISTPPVVSPRSNTKARRQHGKTANTFYYKGEITLSTNEIAHKIEVLQEWEKIAEEAKAEAEALRDEIKQELLRNDVEEMHAGQYIIRWTSVLSQRFDTTAFKKVMPDVYKAYTKQVSSRRFTISA